MKGKKNKKRVHMICFPCLFYENYEPITLSYLSLTRMQNDLCDFHSSLGHFTKRKAKPISSSHFFFSFLSSSLQLLLYNFFHFNCVTLNSYLNVIIFTLC